MRCISLLVLVVCLVAGTAQGSYTQGFENGEITATMIAGKPYGTYDFYPSAGWAKSAGYVYGIDASQAVGYPQASQGNRYLSVDGRSSEATTNGYYWAYYALPSGDSHLETAARQKVSFDFYVDNISDNTTGQALYAYIRCNADNGTGTSMWAYLTAVQVISVNGAWTFAYMGSAAGTYVNGPTVTTGVWHHVDFHFDFSVLSGDKKGAKQTIVLDGSTVMSNGNCNFTGCNVDPTQLSTTANPLRFYWQSQRGNRSYVDNFAYSAETTLSSYLSGTVVPGNYAGDLGAVGIKVQLLTPGTSTVVQTYKVALSDTGTFSIPSVPQGTYDVAIQGPTLLRTVYTNQNINGFSFALGTINLIGGDVDGSNGVDSTDLSIVLANMDQAGQ